MGTRRPWLTDWNFQATLTISKDHQSANTATTIITTSPRM